MWMLIATEPVILIYTSNLHYSAIQVTHCRKTAESMAWLHCVNRSTIWGLFAVVWLPHMFALKYRRWKGSTDNQNGIESWLNHTVFMWLIVLIVLCRGEWRMLIELKLHRAKWVNCFIMWAKILFYVAFYRAWALRVLILLSSQQLSLFSWLSHCVQGRVDDCVAGRWWQVTRVPEVTE